MWLAFFIWGQPEFTSNNLTYIFELIASVFGISIFFLIDLVVLMILFNTFDLRSQTLAWKHFLIFPAIFITKPFNRRSGLLSSYSDCDLEFIFTIHCFLAPNVNIKRMRFFIYFFLSHPREVCLAWIFFGDMNIPF
jgi:hypothetical protein